MDGKPRGPQMSTAAFLAFVRDQRAKLKVFGIQKAEEWSGCKQLIDFLDDLMRMDKSASLKVESPVCLKASSDMQRILTTC